MDTCEENRMLVFRLIYLSALLAAMCMCGCGKSASTKTQADSKAGAADIANGTSGNIEDRAATQSSGPHRTSSSHDDSPKIVAPSDVIGGSVQPRAATPGPSDVSIDSSDSNQPATVDVQTKSKVFRIADATVSELMQIVADKEAGFGRLHAINELERRGEQAADALNILIDEKQYSDAAVAALLAIGVKREHVPRLAEWLPDLKPRVRAALALTIAATGESSAISSLLTQVLESDAYLSDSPEWYAIRRIDPAFTIDTAAQLVARIQDERKVLDQRTCSILAEMGAAAADTAPLLMQVLNDPERDLKDRQRALETLIEITPANDELFELAMDLAKNKNEPRSARRQRL